MGDGHIRFHHGTGEVTATTIDKELADFYLNQLKTLGLIPKISIKREVLRKFPNGKVCKCKLRYVISVYSVILAKELQKRINTIEDWALSSPPEIKKMLFKGFFDAEGSIFIYNKEKRKRYRFSLCNKNIKLLNLFKEIAMSLGFRGGYITKGDTCCCRLSFDSAYNLFLLYSSIGITINRKQKKVESLLSRLKYLYEKKELYKRAYKITKELRKEGLGSVKIKRILDSKGLNINYFAINDWLYHEAKP